jgi:hypothetical protein
LKIAVIPKQQNNEKINISQFSNNELDKFLENSIIKKKLYFNKVKKDILSKHTNNVNKKLKYLKMNDNNFFDIDILLEQLKLMKIFLIELTPEEKREALPKIIHYIDVLIETCEETIEIVKNEIQKNYNNYMRNQRNPHNI